MGLLCLSEIWRQNKLLIQSQERTPDRIIAALKKGARDKTNRLLSVTSINLMETLLEDFSAERNKYAPVIYKGLTFLLVDCYQNSFIKEQIVLQFLILFKRNKSVPINILCEPYLKQVLLSLQNQSNIL